jgi:predicted nucleotidyltransferase
MNLEQRLNVSQRQIVDFCRKHRIRRLALFGSVLRDDFKPDSDVDVLVEFEPGTTPGWEFFGMQRELSEIFGRRVDMSTFNGIKQSLIRDILDSAEDIYVAA